MRRADGGLIDRSVILRIEVDGEALSAHPGDTLASALVAAGHRGLGSGIYTGRPRGLVAAGVDEPNVLVQVLSGAGEPMVAATTIEAHDGLRVRTLAGKGALPAEPDLARYDAVHTHADVVVVGGGPAGIAAALAAGRAGARVLLATSGPQLGGGLLASPASLDGVPAVAWVRAAAAELAGLAEVRVLTRTTVTGYYDHGYLIAVQRRTDHLGDAAPAHLSRQRLWTARASAVVLATGAHERSIAFVGNDVPGVMLAGAAATYATRWAALPGARAVVFSAHDGALAAAVALADAGVALAAVLDVRAEVGPALAAGLGERGVDVERGAVVTGTTTGAEGVLDGVIVRRADGTTRRVEADLLVVSGGWNPAVELWSQSGGSTTWSDERAGFVPSTARQRALIVGAASGRRTLAEALGDGARAGAEAAGTGPGPGPGRPPPEVARVPLVERPPASYFLVPPEPDEEDAVFLDLQRDATLADVRRALGAGLTSVEHVKRFTTIGTAADQGRGSGVLTVGVLARLSGRSMTEIGTTTYRAPYAPMSFALLAGPERGRLADPERVSALHDLHVSAGAVFEDVGQWKRPRYFPRRRGDDTVEDMDAAVRRECAAARTAVAMMDASTLGGIELQGRDVGVFLDRIYTNVFSSLAVGRVRYGLMCGADGMVIDDGTTARIAEDRWLMSTTTGNAAAVLDRLEEWLLTEWPDLDVRCTSVTEQWATVALVGPGSRAVLAAVAPELDCSAEAFGFMTMRPARVGGLPARVARVSFSGELAYEISVAAWYASTLWVTLADAGDITPYGTETMHVLRAEKGFPIVGQDTDGTVTPQDLGLGWAVSKKKDFVGKRSHRRPDTVRADRRQLVGLVPLDGRTRLAEGAQLVAHGADLAATPVPMHGHVTSSYDSVALGTPFALALLSAGAGRHDEVLDAVDDGVATAVRVVSPVPYDPAGARRDG